MNGSLISQSMADCMDAMFSQPFFANDDFFSSLFTTVTTHGETKSYKEDIKDANGKKIGERIVRTYSSGNSKAPKDKVGSNFPPCNIYHDANKRVYYEFLCAGYDEENISFEPNEKDPDVINLVLKSGKTPIQENEDKNENEEKENAAESRVYEYKGFSIKDHVTPFKVDTKRYDIEDAEVFIKNNVATISFGPRVSKFKPKIVKK